MNHFVCYPVRKIESFQDTIDKVPINRKEAVRIFKNKINNINQKFKGENIIKLNKNGKLILIYQNNLKLYVNSKTLNKKRRCKDMTEDIIKQKEDKKLKELLQEQTSEMFQNVSNTNQEEKFKTIQEEKFKIIQEEKSKTIQEEKDNINIILSETNFLNLKKKLLIPKNKVPFIFSKSVQDFTKIGRTDVINIYDLIYKFFYVNETFDKNTFINNLLDIMKNIEDNLSNGLESLSDLGFNYLNISPILTKQDYDSIGNYTYTFVDKTITLESQNNLIIK